MCLTPQLLAGRWRGFSLLQGTGIEIGAFNQPAKLPSGAQVRYLDAIPKAEAQRLFPEVDPAGLVEPDIILDLDRDGLATMADGSLDFVIACHVLEHLADPIGAIAEGLRVLKAGGVFALAIPDKRFTFDRPRRVTPFEHVWMDYLKGVTDSDDDHYADFLSAIIPFDDLPPAEVEPNLAYARSRREHVHVWDSRSFEEMLLLSIPLCGYRAKPVCQCDGDENHFEYFSAWRKQGVR